MAQGEEYAIGRFVELPSPISSQSELVSNNCPDNASDQERNQMTDSVWLPKELPNFCQELHNQRLLIEILFGLILGVVGGFFGGLIYCLLSWAWWNLTP